MVIRGRAPRIVKNVRAIRAEIRRTRYDGKAEKGRWGGKIGKYGELQKKGKAPEMGNALRPTGGAGVRTNGENGGYGEAIKEEIGKKALKPTGGEVIRMVKMANPISAVTR